MKKELSVLAGMVGCLTANTAPAQKTLPRPEEPFQGYIGRTARESTKDFPKAIEAPKGAPNVLVIMTDDVGFAASSTFGGPIKTETMDRLAAMGIRFNNFHTTALSSPTRAALLTGRNHHSAATGVVMELGSGYPGYNSMMPKSCATFAEVLKQNGYNTAWYGKNHNVPDWQGSQAGPFDLWPTGLGFEYFYGFIGGDANQWAPALVENTTPIEPPHDDPDYHFDSDMADKCIQRIRMLSSVAPGRPWLQYYAPGTSHAPHHAPKEWIEKYRGQFDQGWDKVREETFERQKEMGIIPQNATLTPRAPGIPAWDSLSEKHQRLYARMMEVYAGSLAHSDHQMGRVIDAIEELGQLDNTLIIYIQGDNGASAEGGFNGLLNEHAYFNMVPEDLDTVLSRLDELGGPKTYNHFPIGWANAMCTPFQWTKQVASHFGGVRNGVVMAWPDRINDKGTIRNQFHHIIDIAPTIFEACGVEIPTMVNGVPQKPVEGVSMMYTFDSAEEKSRRRTQYFEMLANRAIYSDGWVAATTPPVAPWDLSKQVPPADQYDWELYNVEEDFSQANNLADQYPEKLRELQDLFWIEAAKHNVIPIDNSRAERMLTTNRPSLTLGRSVFTYFPGQTRIPEGAAPDLKNRSYRIGADIVIPEEGASGVIVTQGGRFNGWGLFLQDSRVVFHYNLCDVARFNFESEDPLSPGEHVVVVEFNYDGGGVNKGGDLTIRVDDKVVARGRIDRTAGIRTSLDETFDVGEDTGTPVSEPYQVPFRFTGDLKRVLVRISDLELSDSDKEQIERAKAAVGLAQ